MEPAEEEPPLWVPRFGGFPSTARARRKGFESIPDHSNMPSRTGGCAPARERRPPPHRRPTPGGSSSAGRTLFAPRLSPLARRRACGRPWWTLRASSRSRARCGVTSATRAPCSRPQPHPHPRPPRCDLTRYPRRCRGTRDRDAATAPATPMLRPHPRPRCCDRTRDRDAATAPATTTLRPHPRPRRCDCTRDRDRDAATAPATATLQPHPRPRPRRCNRDRALRRRRCDGAASTATLRPRPRPRPRDDPTAPARRSDCACETIGGRMRPTASDRDCDPSRGLTR